VRSRRRRLEQPKRFAFAAFFSALVFVFFVLKMAFENIIPILQILPPNPPNPSNPQLLDHQEQEDI
jgi:hypothetical protein